MKPIARGRALPILIATAALVGAANLGAYAADGHPLLLGQANHATTSTTVSTTGRTPALTLKTSKKAPPLAVSSSKVVKRLNADRVDGLRAADLGSEAFTYRLPNGQSGVSIRVRHPGTYLISISAMLSLGTPAMCWIEEEPGTATTPEPITIYGTVIGGYNTVTGSTVATFGKEITDINFRCGGPFYSTAVSPSSLGMVRIPAHRVGHVESR